MNKPNLPTKILVVDNDQSVVNTISGICQKQGINVVTALNWETAVYQFNNGKFEVCIVELALGGMSGLTLLQKWRYHEQEVKRNAAFVLMYGQAQKPGETALITEISDTFLIQKTIKEPQLLSILLKAYAAKKQREQLAELQEHAVKPLAEKGDVNGLKALARTKLKTLGVRGQELAAEVLEGVKEFGEAVGEFQDLHNKVPLNMRYLNEIGRLKLLMGDMDGARAAFEEADKAAPDNLLRLRDMARMYLNLDEPEKGVATYKRILDIDPSKNAAEKFDMFEELQSFGYDQHAVEFCKQTTTPLELIRHYNNKGVMHSKDGDYLGALSDYNKAERLIPQSKELYRILFNIAIAHINLKHDEHMRIALDNLYRCLKLNPNYEKAKEKIKMLESRGIKKAS